MEGAASPPGRERVGGAGWGQGGPGTRVGGHGALTSHEDLQQLRHQQQRVAVYCEDRALRGERNGGEAPRAPAPPPRTSRPPVAKVQSQQPLHRLLRGESSGERGGVGRAGAAPLRTAPS